MPTNTLNINKIPLSLYIHIPWCIKKCPYCDFNSHQPKSVIDFNGYVRCLLNDLDGQLAWVQQREITSIFIGGGTPSLLPIKQYRQLFYGIKSRLTLANDCEITMEANPATVEHAPFVDYLATGINRLSLGVQSFDSEKLQALGRIHNRQQAITAIKNAKQAGFTHLNIDLMHGLPNQNLNQALDDLHQAVDLGIAHLSWYQLTIEPNTIFYRNTPILPEDDVLIDIFEQGSKFLLNNYFSQYEVSAWTSENNPQPCRHNMNYWQFGDYLAIGAGAHGKISTPDGIFRFNKSRLPKDYASNQATIGWQKIHNDDMAFEFMMNGLRLKKGIAKHYWQERTGQDWQAIAPTLSKLQQQGLMHIDDAIYGNIQCSDKGFLFLNQVLTEFL
ncbi:coproporphyrinogen III oxidase [Moraxella macacae 0408225]|uniref:Heme chaperone HemW n=1 Tax=Moraxella macacae 0408225 TaxID=1230338 RepID=L2F7A6_9GAMM|nr:radical SAM family heme chaperone HemW [Moraxella macacae]ELA08343.1 coproporphyrinogen III oxidase [Moraxella macacae 0408225]